MIKPLPILEKLGINTFASAFFRDIRNKFTFLVQNLTPIDVWVIFFKI